MPTLTRQIRVANTRDIQGTFLEIINENKITEVLVHPDNLASDARIRLECVPQDAQPDEIIAITCSRAVSNSIRSHEMSVAQLGQMVVSNQKSTSGDAYYSLEKPNRDRSKAVNILKVLQTKNVPTFSKKADLASFGL